MAQTPLPPPEVTTSSSASQPNPPTSAPKRGSSAFLRRRRGCLALLWDVGLRLIVWPLVLVAMLLTWLLWTQPGRDFVTEQLVSYLNREILAVRLEVGRLEGPVLTGLQLHDVRLVGPNDQVLAEVDRLEVHLELLPLLTRRVEITAVHLDGVRAAGRILEDGSLDLGAIVQPSEPTPPSSGPGWQVNVPRIVLDDARFVLRDARNRDSRLVVVSDLGGTLSFFLAADGTISAQVHTLTTRVGPPMAPAARFFTAVSRLQFDLEGDEIRVRIGALQLGRAALSGLLGGLSLDPTGETPFRDVRLQLPVVELDPQTVNELAGGDVLRTALSARLSLVGPPEAVAVRLDVAEATVNAPPIIGVDLVFDVRDFAAPGYGGSIQIARFQPQEWLSIEGLDADISAALQVRGVGITPEDLRATLQLDVGPSRFQEFALEGAWISLAYQDGALQIRALDAWADGVQATVTGSATLYGGVDLNARLAIADLGIIERLVPDVPSLRGSVEARLRLDGDIDIDTLPGAIAEDPIAAVLAALPAFQAGLRVRGRGLRVDDNRIGRLEVDLDVPRSATPTADARVLVRDVGVPGVVRLASATVLARLRDDEVSLEIDVEEANTARTVGLRALVGYAQQTVRVQLDALRASARPLDVRLTRSAMIRAELDDNMGLVAVETTPISLNVNGFTIEAGGRYEMRGVVDLQARIAQMDLEAMGNFARPFVGELAEMGGTLDAGLTIVGPLSAPRIGLTGLLREARYDLVENVDARWNVAYEPGRLSAELDLDWDTVRLLTVRTGEAGIPIRLRLDRGTAALQFEDPIDASVQLAPLDLADVVERLGVALPLGVQGTLGFDLNALGTLREPRGSFRLEWADGAVEIPVPGGTWAVDGLRLAARASYGVQGPAQLELKTRLERNGRQLVHITGLADVPIATLLAGEVAPIEWLEALRGGLHLSAGPVDLYDLPDQVRRLSGLEGGRFDFRTQVSGGLQEASAHLTARAWDVVATGQPPVSARLDVRASDILEVDLRAVAGNTFWATQWADSHAFDPEIAAVGKGDAGDSAGLRLVATAQTGLFDLVRDGYDFATPIAARLQIETLRFASLLPDQAEALGETFAQGWVDVVGSALAPVVRGRVAIRGMETLSGEQAVLGVEVHYEDAMASVDGFLCASDVESLVLEASLDQFRWPLQPDGSFVMPDLAALPLQFRLVADQAPLAALLPVAAATGLLEDVAGSLTMEVTAEGTVGTPEIQGTLRLTDGSAGVVPLNRSFDRISTRMEFTQDGIQIHELELGDAGGRLNLAGSVDIREDAGQPLELRARFKNFYAAGPTGPGAFVDGRMGISADWNRGVLDVDVTIEDLVVTIPDDAATGSAGPRELPETIYFVNETVDPSQVGRPNPRRIGDEEDEQDASATGLSADIRIRTRGTNRVEQAIANLDFTVDLTVNVRPEEVRINGTVGIPSGRIQFVGKQFDVTRGFVQLSGDVSSLDPVLDFRAVHVLSPSVAARLGSPSGESATVTIVVDSQLSELLAPNSDAIQLISDPEMPKADVIYVLLTGRPRAEDSEAGADQQALATAGSLMLGLLGDRLAEGLFIDTLQIEGDSQTGQAVSRVEGGKYISDNIYVSGAYINSTEIEDNDFELSLEWIIARFAAATVRAELRGGNRGKGGLELVYAFTRRGRDRAREEREAAGEESPAPASRTGGLVRPPRSSRTAAPATSTPDGSDVPEGSEAPDGSDYPGDADFPDGSGYPEGSDAPGDADAPDGADDPDGSDAADGSGAPPEL